MKVNITGFMRNLMQPRSAELISEFLGHLKKLRDDPGKHGEFFDLYVFSDDKEFRASRSVVADSSGSSNKQITKLPPDIKEKFRRWCAEQTSLPREYAEVVNRYFWDLI